MRDLNHSKNFLTMKVLLSFLDCSYHVLAGVGGFELLSPQSKCGKLTNCSSPYYQDTFYPIKSWVLLSVLVAASIFKVASGT